MRVKALTKNKISPRKPRSFDTVLYIGQIVNEINGKRCQHRFGETGVAYAWRRRVSARVFVVRSLKIRASIEESCREVGPAITRVVVQDRQRVCFADVAQLVELLICNQQVAGSSPAVGSVELGMS